MGDKAGGKPEAPAAPAGQWPDAGRWRRDRFAAAALAGVLTAHGTVRRLPGPADAARQAADYADALCAELAKREGR